MKKEYFSLVIIGIFLAAYVLNYLAGPVVISLKNPWQFLTTVSLSKYPFTAVEISLKTIALFLSLILALSLIEKNYFLKAIITLILGALGILYAIQQIATSSRVTPIQWTLSFAYAGLTLIPAIGYYLMRGVIESVYGKLTKNKPQSRPPSPESEKKEGGFQDLVN